MAQLLTNEVVDKFRNKVQKGGGGKGCYSKIQEEHMDAINIEVKQKFEKRSMKIYKKLYDESLDQFRLACKRIAIIYLRK